MDVASGLDRFFEITKRGSNISTEVKGGILVFLSMAYIISVNTGMMATSGMDESACYTATIVMSIIGSLLMALYAKYPVAQAPLMGVNSFFTYTIVITMGFTWQQALVAVLISGIIFFAIAVSGVRKRVLDQIPPSLRFGITAGIGCFIMFIGLQNAGIIMEAPPDTTIVSIGDFSSPGVILSFFCIILTIVLYARKVVGAIFIGMVVTAVIGMAFSVIPLPDSVVELPSMPEVGAFMDGISSDLLSVDFLMAVISLAFVQFFDSTGTLMATGERAGIIDKDGNVQCERALLADSATSVISGVVGATPTGSFAESTVGIEAGARTGLASLTVAVLFGGVRLPLHRGGHGHRGGGDDDPAQGRRVGRLAGGGGRAGHRHHDDPDLLHHGWDRVRHHVLLRGDGRGASLEGSQPGDLRSRGDLRTVPHLRPGIAVSINVITVEPIVMACPSS